MTGVLTVSSYPYISYLPQIAAEHLGFYEQEGLQVEHAYHPDQPLGELLNEAIVDKPVDVLVGNIWLSLRSWGGPHPLVPIAHCSQQTRWIVVGRREDAGASFSWDDLKGRSVVFPCDVPTPWVAFRQVLYDAGVSLSDVRPVIGFSTAKHTQEEFIGGVGDYLVTDVEVAQMRGFHEVASIADSVGPIPWSVFVVPSSVAASKRDELYAFRRAIGKALGWIAATAAGEISGVLGHRFPSLPDAARVAIIERYKSLGTGEWPETPAFDPANVANWQDALVRWGLQARSAPLDEVLAFNQAAIDSGVDTINQAVGDRRRTIG